MKRVCHFILGVYSKVGDIRFFKTNSARPICSKSHSAVIAEGLKSYNGGTTKHQHLRPHSRILFLHSFGARPVGGLNPVLADAWTRNHELRPVEICLRTRKRPCTSVSVTPSDVESAALAHGLKRSSSLAYSRTKLLLSFGDAGGLEENVTEATLHEAFVPFGDVKDINIPLDQVLNVPLGFWQGSVNLSRRWGFTSCQCCSLSAVVSTLISSAPFFFVL